MHKYEAFLNAYLQSIYVLNQQWYCKVLLKSIQAYWQFLLGTVIKYNIIQLNLFLQFL